MKRQSTLILIGNAIVGLLSLNVAHALAHPDIVVPTLTDVARNADGSVKGMDGNDADQYCKTLGLRLPTSREFALVATSLRALGIRETAYPGVEASDSVVQNEVNQIVFDGNDGYQVAYKFNSATNQSFVDFYFSDKGFQPGDLLGNDVYGFWSGSADPDYCAFDDDVDAVMGVFPQGERSSLSEAVRCVLSP